MSRQIELGGSWSGRERNTCYLNQGDGTFADSSFVSGLDFRDDGRSVAVVDWDSDGDLDLWFKNRSGPQLRYMNNEGSPSGAFLELRLRGTTSNRDAVGARVEVRSGDRVWRRWVSSGGPYLSQSSRRLHFGLGGIAGIDRVTVDWPGGSRETFEGIELNRQYDVVQGSGRALPVETPKSALPTSARSVTELESTGPVRVLLRQPLFVPPSIRDALGPESPPRQATLINLWAEWCEPCIIELKALAQRAEELQAAGLRVVPLALTESQTIEAARRRFAAEIGWPDAPDRFRTLDAGGRETATVMLQHILPSRDDLPIPTSFLVDPKGRIQMVYIGPVSVDQVLEDSARFGLASPKGAFRSLHSGRWYYRVPRDIEGLAAELKSRKRDRDANFYLSTIEVGGTNTPGSR